MCKDVMFHEHVVCVFVAATVTLNGDYHERDGGGGVSELSQQLVHGQLYLWPALQSLADMVQ